MGSCCSETPTPNSTSTGVSKTFKLLFLGTGNSGKSTIFKQLILIHGNGFTEEQIDSAIPLIYESILTQSINLSQKAKDLKYELNDKTLETIEYIETLPRDTYINSKIADKIEILWKDESIKKAFNNRTDLSIVDSISYFLDNIKRIGKNNYIPTNEDLLLLKSPTTGLNENNFVINNSNFIIFDVGGQRSERRKWRHYYENISGVLFVASLACYDQFLFEDDSINALHESLE